MQNCQRKILFLLSALCILCSGCSSDEYVGPFKMTPLDRDWFVSIAHFKQNKILFMDYSQSFENSFQYIDSFDWVGYKKYIESSRSDVDAIGFAVSARDSILHSDLFKKFIARMAYITQNRKIKYGILLQGESKDIFLEKTPSFGKFQTKNVLRIDRKTIYRLNSLADSIPVAGTKPCSVYISVEILQKPELFPFLDKIQNRDVDFFFY